MKMAISLMLCGIFLGQYANAKSDSLESFVNISSSDSEVMRNKNNGGLLLAQQNFDSQNFVPMYENGNYPTQNYPQNPYSQTNQNQQNSDEVYNKLKSGFLLGIEIPFITIDSTMERGSTSYNISGNLAGVGLKIGSQNFLMPMLGTRYYLHYKYVGGKIKDTEHKLQSQSITFNADLLIDIPFNFQKPSSAIGILIGATLGGATYYDGIYNLPFGFNLGLNFGVNLSFAAKHRIEFFTQWLLPIGYQPDLAEYGKLHLLLASGTTYQAESFVAKNITFSIGYTYNFGKK
ncbi:outer membrane beta-barrel protein [Helicobacter didelphidarum]|nr:outer membrane beta-barrel protein [Helicobacter didelphidarum]